jgi:HSP20 family protein
MPREMTRLFGRPFTSFLEEPLLSMDTMPPLDIFAKGEDLVVRLELPGIKAEDVDISLCEHTLCISGERHEEKEVKEEDYFRRESSYGRFERSLPVPEKVTEKDIGAVYEDGILSLTIKGGAATSTPVKHIEVKAPKASPKEVKAKKG